MVFSSVYFIFLFFPIVLLLYRVVPEKAKNVFLLLVSLVFYAYGEPKFVFVLMGSVVINYLLARLIYNAKRKKIYLVIAIFLNVGLLFFFKYLYFTLTLTRHIPSFLQFTEKIVLPIGISFFTFQSLSYVIDVYRGEKVQTNIIDLGLYICFFPQLIAGPIVRYHDIEPFLKPGNRKTNLESFGIGTERFITGFCKKVLLANNLSVVVDQIFQTPNPGSLTTGQAWLGALCYTLQIYYDFSGYSDMAIGIGRMFGFRFAENFEHPYIASSITDFWRRWHISLSGWFRDYVYIPLGGSRVKQSRHIFNLFIVWLLTGIWHGANLTFLVWGISYFLLLLLEKFLFRPEKFKKRIIQVSYRIITFLCVNFLWVIFRAKDITTGVAFIVRMFGGCLIKEGANKAAFSISVSAYYCKTIREYGIYIATAMLFCFPVRKLLTEKLRNKNALSGNMYTIVILFLFMWAVSFLILGSHNPFLYFNF
ncbi:MAG: MBOAT family protein [Lachnospiraceae bacterium]|nr:MBOAT family protein [Lachnospiraceae bacterium]